MLTYESAIVDELGDVIAWCRDLSEKEIEAMLDEYSEARRTSINVNADDGIGGCYESD